LLIVNSNELDQKDQRKRLLLFKHKEEGNDSNCHRLLRCNKTKKKKVMARTVIALFLAKKKKATTTSCCHLLCCNITKEEGDGSNYHRLFHCNIKKF